MSLASEYETHLTLDVSDFNILNQVSEWVECQQLKWTHIVLDSGQNPSQPMITFWGHGELVSQKARAQHLSIEVARFGASVVRVKIESAADRFCEIPDGDVKDGYFEKHIKLLLADDMELSVLNRIVIPNRARLSRNVRRTRTDGQQERFITQRIHGVDLNASKAQLDKLVADLLQAEYVIIEIEHEFVVFDSHLALDAG